MGVLVQDYIEVYNLLGTRLAIINEAYNIHIEYEANTWPVLRFSVPKKSSKWIYLKEENRIKYYGLYYVIKRTNSKMDNQNIKYQEVECPSIASDLNYKYNQVIGSYSNNELIPTVQNADDFLDLVLTDSGWSGGTTDIPSGTYRTFQSEWQTVPANLLEGKEKFKAFLRYNPDDLTVDMLQEPGEDNGVVIQYAKNMQSIEREIDSSELVTRLYLYGDEDLTVNEVNEVNPGQSYIENFSYFLGLGYTQEQIDDDITLNGEASVFVKVGQYKNTDYVDPTPLYEDGLVELAELCIPKTSYQVKILDLSRISGKSPESFDLYDWVTVINEDLNIDIKARIVRIDYYPRFPEKTEIEISNVFDNLGSVLQRTIQIGDVIKRNTSSSNLLRHIINTFATTINSANGKLVWTDSTLDAIEIDEFGNPTGKIVRLTPGGLGISEDGGMTFVTAITGEGILAETIYANALHILGIGADGITIEAGENGVALNGSEGLVITSANDFTQTIMNAVIGIQIRKGDGSGGNWEPVFWADTEGNIHIQGSIHAKNIKDEEVLVADTSGMNGGLTYNFKNMAHNSNFEVRDEDTGIIRFWDGGVYSDDSSMFGSGSIKLGIGESTLYTPEDWLGLINSNWYADESPKTIGSLYRKGGALRIEILNISDPYTLNPDTTPVTELDCTPIENWGGSRIIFDFEHEGSGTDTDIRIRLTNIDLSDDVYVDGIQLEPEIMPGWPSAYHDGPNSLATVNGTGIESTVIRSIYVDTTEPEDAVHDDFWNDEDDYSVYDRTPINEDSEDMQLYITSDEYIEVLGEVTIILFSVEDIEKFKVLQQIVKNVGEDVVTIQAYTDETIDGETEIYLLPDECVTLLATTEEWKVAT